MPPIADVAARLGLTADLVETYGHAVVKIRLEALEADQVAGCRDESRGRHFLASMALAGLAAPDAIENLTALDRYPLLPAIQAELWRGAGAVDRAIECYRAALGLARSAPEQRWLTSRLSLLV